MAWKATWVPEVDLSENLKGSSLDAIEDEINRARLLHSRGMIVGPTGRLSKAPVVEAGVMTVYQLQARLLGTAYLAQLKFTSDSLLWLTEAQTAWQMLFLDKGEDDRLSTSNERRTVWTLVMLEQDFPTALLPYHRQIVLPAPVVRLPTYTEVYEEPTVTETVALYFIA